MTETSVEPVERLIFCARYKSETARGGDAGGSITFMVRGRFWLGCARSVRIWIVLTFNGLWLGSKNGRTRTVVGGKTACHIGIRAKQGKETVLHPRPPGLCSGCSPRKTRSAQWSSGGSLIY